MSIINNSPFKFLITIVYLTIGLNFLELIKIEKKRLKIAVLYSIRLVIDKYILNNGCDRCKKLYIRKKDMIKVCTFEF